MKFKQYQFLKATAIDRLKEESWVEDPKRLEGMDALTLAYLGDSYYSTYVRRYVLQAGIYKSRILHDLVTAIICAKAQAQSFIAIEEELTPQEAALAKRARNSTLHVPKSADLWEYQYSTAFEALLGYHVMAKDGERLQYLCERALRTAIEKL